VTIKLRYTTEKFNMCQWRAQNRYSGFITVAF